MMCRCPEHGLRKWRGHLKCAACAKLYPPESVRKHPKTCDCGMRLTPGKDRKTGEELVFSGRVLCAQCYDARTAHVRAVT